jgi:hypothetical protein
MALLKLGILRAPLDDVVYRRELRELRELRPLQSSTGVTETDSRDGKGCLLTSWCLGLEIRCLQKRETERESESESEREGGS